jgi:hypothetical protein
MNQIDNIMELYEEAAAAMCNVVKNPGDKYWIDKHQWHYDKLRAAIEQALGSGEPGLDLLALVDENQRLRAELKFNAAPQPQPKPVAWGMTNSRSGQIYDCISPAQHAEHEGSYTVPLFTYPPDDTALLHQCFEVLTGPTCHQSTQWARLVEVLEERLK